MRARKVDPREFEAPTFVDKAGHAFYGRKPGRRKRITAAQGATVFELLVQQRAARNEIRRILLAAGYVSKTSQNRMMTILWADRGRIDGLRRLGFPNWKAAPIRVREI